MTQKTELDGVDVTRWTEGRQPYQPASSDLGQSIEVASITLEDDPTIGPVPVTPANGSKLKIYDDDHVTVLLYARVSNLHLTHVGTRARWILPCQSFAVRMYEGATSGAMDKSAVTDTDRNFVIAIVRDALKGVTSDPNGATLSDPLIAVNEANQWAGVQATTLLAGSDWRYKRAADALVSLRALVPNVYWRIEPDLTVTWGLFRQLAPFAVSDYPVPAGFVVIERAPGYSEERILAGHVNKMTRGGAGGSTATAYDPVSIAKYGVIESPYAANTTVPAADLQRRTNAELRAARERTKGALRVTTKGLKAGMLLDVLDQKLGAGTAPHPFVGMFNAQIMARSVSGSLAGERGRFLIQKVHVSPLTPGLYAYDLELGDNVRDLSTTMAKLT